MSLESNAYRRAWAAWLPGALPLLEAEQYAEAFRTFPKPEAAPVPFRAAPRDRRIAVVTSAGVYDRRTQAAFAAHSAIGDTGVRFFPQDLPVDRLAYAHGHYDREHVDADAEVLLPRAALRAAGAELTPTIASFMGYTLDWPSFIESSIPQLLAQARTDGANCALLVPV
ncbi:MAG: hypothetical protein ABR591_14885 [Candidatus Velthaea sp.]